MFGVRAGGHGRGRKVVKAGETPAFPGEPFLERMDSRLRGNDEGGRDARVPGRPQARDVQAGETSVLSERMDSRPRFREDMLARE